MKRNLMSIILCIALIFSGITIGEVSAEDEIMTEHLSEILIPSDLVDVFLSEDPGITYSNVIYTGADVASGVFSNAEAILGMNSGVILSSGHVDNIIGPNEKSDEGYLNRIPGDSDLELKLGVSTFDASILEFDFVPENDRIKFMYIFGSEEYNEYVGQFNDGFAFYVNGNDYALLPNGAPVSINTINSEQNALYFIDNTSTLINTEMDGFTVVVSLEAEVIPNETNHLKMVVGDALDTGYDSFVLLKMDSMTCKYTDLSLNMDIDDTEPIVGEEVSVTLTVKNSGPDDSEDVCVRYTVPAGLVYQSANGDGNYDETSGIWNIGSIENGCEASTTLTFIVDTSSQLELTAEIVSASLVDIDSIPDNNVESEDDIDMAVLTPYLPTNDLSLEMAIDDSTPIEGDDVTITLTVTNSGPDDAEEVIVEYILPEGLVYRSANGDGNYDEASGIWRIGTLANGNDVSFSITATAEGNVLNVAEIIYSKWTDPDSIPGNGLSNEDDYDSQLIGVTDPVADLSLDITVVQPPQHVGDSFEITATISNEGPFMTSSVSACITLPQGVTITGVQCEGTFDEFSKIWHIGTIIPETQYSITFLVTAIEEINSKIKGEIISSALYDPDSVPANNSENEDDDDSWSLRVSELEHAADLSLTKNVDNSIPFVGSYVTYTLTVSNNGPMHANDVTVRDNLPSELEFVSFSGNGTYDHVNGIWNIGTIENGATCKGYITVIVNKAVPVINIAEISSSSILDNDSFPDNCILGEDDYDKVIITPRDNIVNILVYYHPTEEYMSSYANELWNCIMYKIEDNGANSELLDAIQEYLNESSCAKTAIYKVGKLNAALELLETLAEEVGCIELE